MTLARRCGVAPRAAWPLRDAVPSQARAPFSFAALKGRPVLVVNVASACGLTAQNYEELVDIYQPLKEKKQLEVLAFPCDQFMHQEKGDTAAVCSFAARKGAKWPIFDKARAACYSFSARRCMHAVLTAHARMPRRCHAVQVEVNGPGTSPVYAFLKASSGDPSDVEWNFGKFLLDGSGKVVKRYPPDLPPKALVKDIEAL